MNDEMASETLSGWKKIFSVWKPAGSCRMGLREPSIDGPAHVGNDGRRLHGNAEGQCRASVDEKSVALRRGITPLHAGHIADTQLTAVHRADLQVADFLHVIDRRIDIERNAFVAGRIRPGIDRLAGLLQGRHDLRRDYAIADDLLLREDDIDHLVAVASDVDPLDPLHVEQFAPQELGVAIHLRIVVTVGRQAVEDAVDIHHVVDDNRVVAPLGQARRGIIDLAAQQVEMLFQVAVQHRHLELDGQHRRAVAALALDLLDVGQRPQFILHHLRHLELHLVGAGPRVGDHDHRLLDRHGRILQFGHLDERQKSGDEDGCHERPEQDGPPYKKFGRLHHNSPPALV